MWTVSTLDADELLADKKLHPVITVQSHYIFFSAIFFLIILSHPFE